MKPIFDRFNITDPRERTTDSNILAEALKVPSEDFKKLPWKDMIKKYDKHSLLSWMTQVRSRDVEIECLKILVPWQCVTLVS